MDAEQLDELRTRFDRLERKVKVIGKIAITAGGWGLAWYAYHVLPMRFLGLTDDTAWWIGAAVFAVFTVYFTYEFGRKK
ncbi:MAG TPA: hypothetical protein VN823_10895 [Stellaceae bacterium]|nr:hypothetical protein [Stellaceae bacterium]